MSDKEKQAIIEESWKRVQEIDKRAQKAIKKLQMLL